MLFVYFLCLGHFLGENTVLDVMKSKGYDVSHVEPGEELDLG